MRIKGSINIQSKNNHTKKLFFLKLAIQSWKKIIVIFGLIEFIEMWSPIPLTSLLTIITLEQISYPSAFSSLLR